MLTLRTSDSSKSLQLQAYGQIREAILYVNYAPGSRLQIKDLCQDLGVGRTPVRESLVRLSQEGLVEMVPQSGTYVSKISLRAIESARYAREGLEHKIAADCCARATPESVEALDEMVRRQDGALEREDARAFFDYDNQFHGLMYEIAGQGLIWTWLDAISADLQRYRWLRLHTGELGWQEIVDEHRAICSAIEEHDVGRACHLASGHTRLLIKENSTVTKAFPDYFVNDR